MNQEWKKDEFTISTDPQRLDLEVIHEYLVTHSYWAQGRSFETVERSISNSLNFGLYKGDEQVGFARVVTDRATFAWLGDVFILPDYRGKGLSKWLMEVIVTHPELQGLKRWILATRDAHELYRRFGFKELAQPDRWMERFNPNS
ncbi:MAG TPA: GNAT family N-acetyltransferase [Pyrinomonadaceae bacterium]|jgi:GNAT superfamily N-acetyltransferase